METAASAGEAEGGFGSSWSLSWVLKGHCEHAEGKEEGVLGSRPSSEGNSMFSGCGIRPA